MDFVDISHIAICDHRQQLNDSTIGNFSIPNFSEMFHIFFLKFDLNRFSTLILLQILLKLYTMQLEALINNKIIEYLEIFIFFI